MFCQRLIFLCNVVYNHSSVSNHSLKSTPLLISKPPLTASLLSTSSPLLASNYSLTSRASLLPKRSSARGPSLKYSQSHPNSYIASEQECADIDKPCNINGSSSANDTLCADVWGWLPCTFLKYSASHAVSTGRIPVVTYTNTEYDIPSSCLGDINAEAQCEGRSFPISAASVWTDGGGLFTQTHYSGPVPPVECSDGCDTSASHVRIIFWPVDDDNSTALQNVSAEASPYTTVSDGFTLYVGL